jgi:hypothetical protein
MASRQLACGGVHCDRVLPRRSKAPCFRPRPAAGRAQPASDPMTPSPGLPAPAPVPPREAAFAVAIVVTALGRERRAAVFGQGRPGG